MQQAIDTPRHGKQPRCKTADALRCPRQLKVRVVGLARPRAPGKLQPTPRRLTATARRRRRRRPVASHTRSPAQSAAHPAEYDLPYLPCISRDRTACLPRTHAWRHRRIPRSVVCVGRMEWTDNARQQHESVTGQRVHTRADNNYSVLGEATRTRNGAFLRRQENPQRVEPWIGWIDGSDGGMDSRAARAL